METASIIGGEVKSDRLGHVKGYLVRFGDPYQTDLEGDFFTPGTDFGFPAGKGIRVPLNLYYHHGMDSKIGRKSIGTGFVKMDEVGLWYEAQIDMADEYGQAIAKLAKAGKMGYSSGAAGHLVDRKMVSDCAAEIIRWPIAEASITPTPAEWRNTVKSLFEMANMEGYEEENEDEMEAPMVPVSDNPEEFAGLVFSGIRVELLHEGLEALYEALCSGIEGVAMRPEGDRAAFVQVLIDEFARRASEMAAMLELDAKSLRMVSPDTLRNTERRLRDAVGLSRSDAKRLAPEIWNALRDADQTEGTDIVEETSVKAVVDIAERDALLERINLLMEL
jgi:phage head maturation protease